jgi:Ca2+-binding RTX toxin-like protein
MRGDAANDSLYGGDGDDTLDGGTNRDTLTGGAGADRFRFSGVGDSTTAQPDVVTDYTQGTDRINLHNMALDDLGSAAGMLSFTYDGVNDRTVVSDATSTFQFYISGNVVLTSADLVYSADTEGTAGADVINAAGGIYGGGGGDTVTATGAASIHGGDGGDTVTGSASADRIHGGAGNDSIDGGSNVDTLYGGAGDDTLIGGASADRLYGGEGNDTLTGGTNGDFFHFDRNAAGHDDHITDMTTASDKIVLSDAAFVFASGEGAKNGVNLTDNTDIFDVAGFAGGEFRSGGGGDVPVRHRGRAVVVRRGRRRRGRKRRADRHARQLRHLRLQRRRFSRRGVRRRDIPSHEYED